MSPSGIEALTFDVFGTVVDWRTSIAREAATLFAERGVTRDWHAFADAWRARYQPAMAEVREGRRPWVPLDTLHRENLIAVLAVFGLDGLDGASVDHLNRAWHRLDPWPDAVPGLVRLSQRHIVAALSNGNVALMVNLAKRAGLPWDVILGAEVVRAYKPMPEAYSRSAELLGRAPSQCLMVAAHGEDLIAAARQGFRTAFVARPSEHGPGQQTDLHPPEGVDLIARDLVDLAAQLGP